MNRARLWIARNHAPAAYLLIVALVAIAFVIAASRGGW